MTSRVEPMTSYSPAVEEKITKLATSMLERKLAFSQSQARERAREIVLQEISMQTTFDQHVDEAKKNPEERKRTVSDEKLKQSGGFLKGNELEGINLSEMLRRKR